MIDKIDRYFDYKLPVNNLAIKPTDYSFYQRPIFQLQKTVLM